MDLFTILTTIPAIAFMLGGLVSTLRKYKRRKLKIALWLSLIFTAHLIAAINGLIYLYLFNNFGHIESLLLIPIINGYCFTFSSIFMLEITKDIFYSDANNKKVWDKGITTLFILTNLLGLINFIFFFSGLIAFLNVMGLIAISICFSIYFFNIYNVIKLLNWSKKMKHLNLKI